MKLLTVKEIADLLKAKPSTIYQWVEQGIIPCYKLKRNVRFDEEEILKWLKACKNPVKPYNSLTGRSPRKGAK